MIAYDLCCEKNHTFEAWFKDRKAYEEQCEKRLIECPFCGSKSVRKVLSAVSIKKVSRKNDGSSSHEALMDVLHHIYTTIEKNTEDVGTDFAKEALKMHYGLTEPKNIRGIATPQEEKTLQEEGIDFIKIPVVKKNRGH